MRRSRASIAEQTERHLDDARRYIFVKHNPGEEVNENAVAKGIRVDRKIARRLISQLGYEGLLKLTPRVGTTVNRTDVPSVIRTRELHFRTDYFLLHQLIRFRNRNFSSKKQKLIETMQTNAKDVKRFQRGNEILSEEETYDVLSRDDQFHRTLVDVADYPEILLLVRQSFASLLRLHIMMNKKMKRKHAILSLQEQGNIFYAALTGGAEEATVLLRQYFQQSFERVFNFREIFQKSSV